MIDVESNGDGNGVCWMSQCMLWLCLLLGALVGTAAVAAPQLQVTPESYELGRQVRNAGQYPLVFKLKNTGDEPLKIESVRGGCACLSVALPKRELAPNEEIDLAATFNAAGYEGHVQKAVFLTSNDATSQARVLSFHVFLPYSSAGLRFKPHGYRIPVEGRNLKVETGDLKLETRNLMLGEQESHSKIENRQSKIILHAAPVVENCNAAGTITLTGVKLPDGWRCSTTFPIPVNAESSTAPIEFIRDDGQPLPPNAELLFTFATDSPKQPELKAVLVPAPKPTLPSPAKTLPEREFLNRSSQR